MVIESYAMLKNQKSWLPPLELNVQISQGLVQMITIKPSEINFSKIKKKYSRKINITCVPKEPFQYMMS
jgi:hypothetical protein